MQTRCVQTHFMFRPTERQKELEVLSSLIATSYCQQLLEPL